VTPLSADDLRSLGAAKATLEHPTLAIRIADRIGTPIEGLVRRLPEPARRAVAEATHRALGASLDAALRTLDARAPAASPPWLHRGLVLASGAAGGAAGLPGLLLELPLSLTVMLRAIAEHARAEGEDLAQASTRLECLAVFAYGSRASSDDAADSAYFAARAALAGAVSRAVDHVLRKGLAGAAAERGAPALVQLVARIAQRLGIAIGNKAAAQLVPVLGAAGGAALNALFLSHFEETARAHFTVRRLERAHGTDAVRRAYQGL
jgi:hypothetical protein